MMVRTHLVIALCVGLLLFPFVTHKITFLPLLIIATLLPDVDCAHSYLGKYKVFRPLQWLVKHRGMIHSLTICLGICILLLLIWPVASLPFFVGYALHLFGDAMTVEGIRPWWPFDKELKGKIRTGGTLEKVLFFFSCGIAAILVYNLVF